MSGVKTQYLYAFDSLVQEIKEYTCIYSSIQIKIRRIRVWQRKICTKVFCENTYRDSNCMHIHKYV